ncbi:hypothetical protein [Hymenobacter metallicola]|uniref:Lipocalin-like domain-containing protein n=1 Tax=Hymenobacter metallicola TaxID=2563114 RepID=A0A4Z0PVA1_9BACT|nr:hypothetical protein [Hymenobacter metallicola]TGE20901.1 hypothetical protein E5K02_25200 [Hymenobacter metallicola]
MPRLLPLLLLCLTLLPVACTKDSDLPTLKGRWNYTSSTTFVYNTDGTLREAVSSSIPVHYIAITPAFIITYINDDTRPY